MTVDVAAEVLFNRRLSEAYNVLGLAAPDVARHARPGQFVMVQRAGEIDPLLRRPFSIFERLVDDEGRVIGLSLLNKRVGRTTGRLYDARPGDVIRCLGPLGQPFTPAPPPADTWMVAGGVGLAAFALLAQSVSAAGRPARLFYGARHAGELFCTELFEREGTTLDLATEDGSAGERGLVTAPLERALASTPAGHDVVLYACGPTAMMRAVSALGASYKRHVEVSLEQVMGCGLGGCYSCVVRVRRPAGGTHFVRSCLAGPVFAGAEVVWEAVGH
jgi:dihydroorotate dehydrogenase electron transfer subunit